MKVLLTYCFLILFSQINSQDINAFYIGHSLSDQIPDMVRSLAQDDAQADFDWVYQSIPGAPLRWQWQDQYALQYSDIEPHYYSFYDPIHGLPSGDFDVLVLTESVPRYTDIIEETHTYVDSFIEYATAHNSDIQIYLYEPWHCILSGTPTGCEDDINSASWRQRLTDDLHMWEDVVNTANNRHKTINPICLIPVGQGLGNLYDSIILGEIEGLSSIEQLFADNIHLNDWGKYFVACVHYAAIFGRSPQGLTNQLQYWWGGDFEHVPNLMAENFQQIAWETVMNYPHSCFSISENKTINHNGINIDIYPNPFSDILYLENIKEYSSIKIFNLEGVLLHKSCTNQSLIDLSFLPIGLYYVQLYSNKNGIIETKKIIKSH